MLHIACHQGNANRNIEIPLYGQPLGKAVWWILTKVSMLSPCDAAVWLLDIYPQETTTLPRRNVPEDVCVSFVHNCKNMEATTPPFSG